MRPNSLHSAGLFTRLATVSFSRKTLLCGLGWSPMWTPIALSLCLTDQCNEHSYDTLHLYYEVPSPIQFSFSDEFPPSQAPFVVSVLAYLPYRAIYVSLITPFATSSNGPLQPTALQRYYLTSVTNLCSGKMSLLLRVIPKVIADTAPPSLSAHESLLTIIILHIKLNVCLYLIQIHISEPIWTKLCTHLPLGLEETVGYVWCENIWPFLPF
jgi:hypothetical protein